MSGEYERVCAASSNVSSNVSSMSALCQLYVSSNVSSNISSNVAEQTKRGGLTAKATRRRRQRQPGGNGKGNQEEREIDCVRVWSALKLQNKPNTEGYYNGRSKPGRTLPRNKLQTRHAWFGMVLWYLARTVLTQLQYQDRGTPPLQPTRAHPVQPQHVLVPKLRHNRGFFQQACNGVVVLAIINTMKS